jgi:tetratricopeptide (TPR) repeat protein
MENLEVPSNSSVEEEGTLIGPISQSEKSSLVSLIAEGEEGPQVRSTPVKKTKPRFLWPFRKREKPPSEPIDEIPLRLRRQLMCWIEAFETIPGGRRYLENHLKLLREESEQFFMILLSKAKDHSGPVEQLRITLELLRTIRAHGNTKTAVYDAFIDRFGALMALGLSPWLNELAEQLANGISTLETIRLLRDAIERAQQDASLQPEIVPSLQMNLAKILLKSSEENAYAEVITLAENALNVFTSTRFPRLFAGLQELLGLVFFLQASEAKLDRRERYMRHAVKCFKSALSVLTPEEQLQEWCQNHLRLAQVYEFKGAIKCAQLHLTKALEVLSVEREPDLYAMLQEKLDTISMALVKTDVELGWLEQAFDSDMAEGVRIYIDAMDDCAENEFESEDDDLEGYNGQQ